MNKGDYIEKFIRENSEKFTDYSPPENHMRRFLLMMNLRLRRTINIVPHLSRVAIITFVVFITSFLIWNNYIRTDREYMTLRAKFYDIVDVFLR
jgi:hypothetical protein